MRFKVQPQRQAKNSDWRLCGRKQPFGYPDKTASRLNEQWNVCRERSAPASDSVRFTGTLLKDLFQVSGVVRHDTQEIARLGPVGAGIQYDTFHTERA